MSGKWRKASLVTEIKPVDNCNIAGLQQPKCFSTHIDIRATPPEGEDLKVIQIPKKKKKKKELLLE